MLNFFWLIFVLFEIGLIGIFYNEKHFILIFFCLEITFLSSILGYSLIAFFLGLGLHTEIFSLFILAISASELSLGLALIILHHKLLGSIDISIINK